MSATDEAAIDEELRVALDRLYPVGDPEGVSIDVWERVSAGETGTPGGRGDLPPGPGLLSFLAWIGGALLVGLLAFGGSAAGYFGANVAGPGPTPSASSTPTLSVAPILIAGTPAYDCPWATVVTTIPRHARVLAVHRNEDTSFIAVRDPRDGALVWVFANYLVPEAGASFAELPVAGCANGMIPIDPTTGPEAATPEEIVIPEGPDTTAPYFTGASVSYTPETGYVCTENPSSAAIILANAFDDRLVASVTATWDGSGAGTAQLTSTTSGWALNYHPTNLSITETITFTLIARDAAGNASAPTQVVVQRDQCPG